MNEEVNCDLLSIAASRGDIDELRRLLDMGVDIDALNEKGIPPLIAAATNAQREVVDFLLEQGADRYPTDYEGPLFLFLVARQGWVDLTAQCLNEIVEQKVLERKEFKKFCGMLLEEVFDTYVLGDTRTLPAKDHDWVSVVQLVLKRGVSPHHSSEGRTLLWRVAEVGATECARELLEAGAKVDGPLHVRVTPLYAAASNCHVSTVRLLLEYGADLNRPNKEAGATPLVGALTHYSTSGNVHEETACLLETARLLLEAGANPNAMDAEGMTPFYRAVFGYGVSVDVLEMLLSYGAHVGISVPERGHSIFARFVERGDAEFTEFLLRAGADPNAANRKGRTALHHAAAIGRAEPVRALLAGGADPSLRDNDGQTPLDLARARRNKKVIALLDAIS